MGYYTNFELSIKGGVSLDKYEEIAEALTDISSYEWDSSLEYSGIKWYNWHHDMIELSKRYPDFIFTLDGDGEESGDIWRYYYKNGKHQADAARMGIIYEPFDESKLV